MKAIKLFVTMMLLGIMMGVAAQTPAVELKIKASKDAKKQAKAYKKEKWEVAPGGLPIERQLDRSYLLEYDTNLETGESKFVFGEDIATGQFYSAAKLQASELAKADLVGKLHIEITREVTAIVKNKQLTEKDAQSVAAVTEKSKSIVIQRLEGIEPVLELHRKLKNDNVQVMIRYAYNRAKAKKDTFEFIDAELKKEGIDLGLVQ